jgi:hypothetical protein
LTASQANKDKGEARQKLDRLMEEPPPAPLKVYEIEERPWPCRGDHEERLEIRQGAILEIEQHPPAMQAEWGGRGAMPLVRVERNLGERLAHSAIARSTLDAAR